MTVRTMEELLDLVVVGAPGAITAQTLRDFIESAMTHAPLVVDRQVTHAELLDLVANPIELVAAPGADWFIDLLGVVAVADKIDGYTVFGTLRIGESPGVGGQPLAGIEMDVTERELSGFNRTVTTSVSLGPDLPLLLTISGGQDMTGGDPANTLSLRVYYRIEPAVPFGA